MKIGNQPIMTRSTKGIATLKVRLISEKSCVLLKYRVMEHQVKKQPNPRKCSHYTYGK